MLLVRQVAGPETAEVGERVTYRVTGFNQDDVEPAAAAAVNWLVKTPAGTALTHVADGGPVLELVVPAAWGGETAVVMPYLNSPSTRIAVRTRVASAPEVPGQAIEEVVVVREGRRYYASVDGAPRFYLGTDVRYGARRGLLNLYNPPGARYLPPEWEAEYGAWAWYLWPTASCESRSAFSCLNTYDRAAFTFGFHQFAAHTPDDNLVLLLRELLALPLAAAYFPDLALAGGRLHRRRDGGLVALESAEDTAPLMAYFNPDPEAVGAAEAERAARIVDWSLRDPAFNRLQVDFALRHMRRKLARHARRLPLDGLADRLCLVVFDVLHQGRAGYRTIRQRLAAADPFDALLTLGATAHRHRVATLRAAILDLEARGHAGRRVYDAAANAFVEPAAV